MSLRNVKIGSRETSIRHDGKVNVWQFMADPTLSQEDLDFAKSIDYTPARWVVVEVRNRAGEIQ